MIIFFESRILNCITINMRIYKMTKNILKRRIRVFHIKRLIPAIIFIVFLGFVWTGYPFHAVFFPKEVTSTDEIATYYSDTDRFIEIQVPVLYYTGYDYVKRGEIRGSYYYTFMDEKCVLLLLSTPTNNEGNLEITDLTVRGKLVKGNTTYKDLLVSLSSDLEWTYEGLSNIMFPIVISEVDYSMAESYGFFALLCVSFVISLYSLVSNIISLIYPGLSPSCLHLRKSGNSAGLLYQANEEFLNDKILSTETMFITRHYFIELSKYGIAVIPLNKIIWVYKHSIFSHFLWFQTRLTYTLRLITANGQTDCLRQKKEDADAMIIYLQSFHPDLLVGFSNENKMEAKKRKKLII